MKRVLIALLLCVGGLAQAQPAYLFPYRPQLQGDPRHMPPPHPGGQQRWEERRRLREDVRGGGVSRDDSRRDDSQRRQMEGRRLSPEQREQLRRDILDANRNLGRR